MRQGVLWLTGLSGAGKSTVAGLVRDGLPADGRRPVLLDGDRLREVLPVKLGYEREDRLRLAMFYARLANNLAAQGHLVICSTISLFHQVQAWNRDNTPGYLEVWLRVPVSELSERDGRSALYNAEAGSHVVGLDSAAEFPLAPDLIIDNYGDTTPDKAAEQVLAMATRKASQ
ncbi:adenylyl-sulfate kinase [Streptomyces diacarni]|uniref:adenylyl-sulfate kinase n=1 Tax=Streptomyces diacarni TaxID=2800381 RepID=UPI00340E431A